MLKITRKRRATVVSLLAATAVMGGLTLAPSASAANAGDCPNNALCLYQDTHFSGQISIQTRFAQGIGINDFRNSHFTNGQSINDQVSSLINNTNYDICLFVDINESGKANWIPKKGGDLGFPNTWDELGPVGFNDDLSSAWPVNTLGHGCQHS